VHFIVGVHRSGTSAASQIAGVLGADLGPREGMIPAYPSNPHGHWENASLVDINREILRRLGGHWDSPPPLPSGWQDSRGLDDLRERASDLVAELFLRSPAVFKDPRSSLLLPFWRTVTDIDGVVLVVRDPTQVARSLHERNEHDLEHGAMLWVVHTVIAWVDSENPSVFAFEDLVAEPDRTASALARALGLPEPSPETLTGVRHSLHPIPRESVTATGGPWMDLATVLHGMITTDRGGFATVATALADAWRKKWTRDVEARALQDQLAVATEVLEAAMEEAARAQAEATTARARFDRLRSRRSVRLALRLAAFLAPVFRWRQARSAESDGRHSTR